MSWTQVHGPKDTVESGRALRWPFFFRRRLQSQSGAQQKKDQIPASGDKTSLREGHVLGSKT